MAERDTTPVTVTLDRQRPYRAYDADREAVWVGPGECEVPRWVAQEWGMVAKDEEPNSPPAGTGINLSSGDDLTITPPDGLPTQTIDLNVIPDTVDEVELPDGSKLTRKGKR